MESDPDPTVEAPQFAKTLHAKLEHIYLSLVEGQLEFG